MIQLSIGNPEPAGSHFDGKGVNFSLYSAYAEKVELCLFDAEGNETRYTLPGHSGSIWHGYVPGLLPGQRYGYRVHGPWQPAQGLRFNPCKLLIDPCARQIEGFVADDPLLQGGLHEPDLQDSAPAVPKSVVVSDDYDWQGDKAPRIPWGETVIYEAHTRGLTLCHPELPPEIRGTYKALGHPVMIAYFQRLGITALELLPVIHFTSEPRLMRLGLTNYWGYNPLAFFAVEPRYATGCRPDLARDEFRDAVKALHKAGIEVIIDIVLNHSAEIDLDGPTLSLRGIDNRSYYWIQGDGDYNNWTGCGNTLNLNSPGGLRLTLDCLRYWVGELHVDGFRFDLATVMGRTPDYRPDAPLFDAIRQEPLLCDVKLIAEPWDIGPGGYQVGHFPPPFAEWNDIFRDNMRRFWLRQSLSLADFADSFAASSEVFRHDERLPSASINLVTAHDGFTLRDCVSFNDKHNEANGEDNRDGTGNNLSNNHGYEGIDGSPDMLERRKMSCRALLTSLLLAQGTPMLLAGDEFGQTQHGNNNAYCQDNALTWLDWEQGDRDLMNFTAALIHLRKTIPALTRDSWWDVDDGHVRWLNQRGEPLSNADWQCGAQHMQIELSGAWLLAINATSDASDIVLPTGEWRAISPFAGANDPVVMAVWEAPAHGVCVFQKSK